MLFGTNNAKFGYVFLVRFCTEFKHVLMVKFCIEVENDPLVKFYPDGCEFIDACVHYGAANH